MSDEPIIDQEWLSGLTVVDIGDIRVSRGLTRRPHSSCSHRRLAYDRQERRVWCKDCEKDVDAFDAFESIAVQCHKAYADINTRYRKLEEAEQFQARSRAVKALDKVWMSRNMVPACPSCGNGLLPEDFADGVKTRLGRDYAEARRRKVQK